MDFCKETENLWHIYFSTRPEHKRQIMDILDPQCVIIGTGADEIYHQLSDFVPAMELEFSERLDFQFKDLWCREKRLGEDSVLTYGGLHIWWESPDNRVVIDMDSRFTILYQRRGESWKVVHIHHSVPNQEQRAGEFYPKTLVTQLREIQDRAVYLKRLADRDGLTGLINYRALKNKWQHWEEPDSWLFLLDLDDFKQVNDTFGHMAGNEVLKKVSAVLERTVGGRDLVCRIGGDEFVLLLSGVEQVEELARRLLWRAQQVGRGEACWTSLSMGGTPVRAGEALEDAIRRADAALYRQKRIGKNGYLLDRDDCM